MPREQVDPGQLTERLQPQAAPVNTFVEASSDPGAGKNLMDLAQALRGFGGDLDGLLSKKDAEQKQADYLAGQEAFYSKNKDGFAQGVAQGSIPAQASPSFTRGLSEAQGDAAGSDLSMRFQTAYDQWDGKSYAGQDAPQRFAEWRKGWLQDQVKAAGNADPFFFKGLKPHLEAVTSASNNVFTKDQHDLVYNGAISTAGTQVMQRADDLYSRGLGSGTGTDYGQVFAQTQALRAGLISNGVREDDATKMANEAMVAAATKYKEPGFLRWFDQENPQKKAAYGQDPAGVVQADQARKTVDTLQRQDLSESSLLFDRKQKAEKERIEGTMVSAIAANPSAPVDPQLLTDAKAAGMGDFPVKVMQVRKTFLDGLPSDATTILHLQQDMLSDPANAMGNLTKATTGQLITSPDDFTKLHTLAKDLAANADGVGAIIGSVSTAAQFQASGAE